jgi:hypothetical protein
MTEAMGMMKAASVCATARLAAAGLVTLDADFRDLPGVTFIREQS